MFDLIVEIPDHPPSINHTYGFNGRRRFKDKRAVRWQTMAEMLTQNAAMELYGTFKLEQLVGKPIKLELFYYRETWRGKAKPKRGLYVRPDLDGFLKISIDSVFNALGLDDCAVIELVAHKVEQIGPNKLVIKLKFIDEVNN